MEKRIDDLIKNIGSTYIIKEFAYPMVKHLPPDSDLMLNFSLTHSLKHMVEKTGRIARKKLIGEHNSPEENKAIYSLLISAFKMAEILEIRGEKIVIALTSFKGPNKEEQFQKNFLQLLVDMSYVADILEKNDHGGALDEEKIRTYVMNCIDDIVVMADAHNISFEQLIDKAPSYL
jgi:hypothetical protein